MNTPEDVVSSGERGLPRSYHSPQIDVAVRLNTNETPEPPPEAFLADLREIVSSLRFNRYPDREATRLRAAIADLHRTSVENVFCANGSNEVLQCIFLAFGGPGRTCLLFEPTYALHSHIARLTRTEVVTGERDADFLIPTDQLGRLIPSEPGERGPDVVFVCSPNNPTGRLEPETTSRAICERSRGLVVIDEAYAPFAGTSAIAMLAEHANLIVVRTLSKAWALAGLRLGYAIARPEVVDSLFDAALPYHLDAFKQAAGVAAIRYENSQRQRVARLVAERERVAGELRSIGVDAVPSDANFLLVRLGDRDAKAVWQALLDRSVLVRDVSEWPRLSGCLRVTIGLPEENDAFLSALRASLDPAPGTETAEELAK